LGQGKQFRFCILELLFNSQADAGFVKNTLSNQKLSEADHKELQETLKSLANNPKFNEAVLQDLHAIAKKAKLHGFEFIKAVKLVSAPFTPENDLLTPTFKLRRQNLLKYYKSDIEALYKRIDELEAKSGSHS
jgi:long-subunit acyl-CoA synthetase (AMP-forming)